MACPYKYLGLGKVPGMENGASVWKHESSIMWKELFQSLIQFSSQVLISLENELWVLVLHITRGCLSHLQHSFSSWGLQADSKQRNQSKLGHSFGLFLRCVSCRLQIEAQESIYKSRPELYTCLPGYSFAF